MAKINELIGELQTIAKFNSAIAVLGWDEEVNLPKKAHAYRGEVLALLSSESHSRLVSPTIYSLITSLARPATFKSLSEPQQVIVRESKRDIELSRKLPVEFVENMARLTSKAFPVWVEARQKSNFKIFEPVLAEIIKTKQQEAKLLGYKDSPYDALIDTYEPNMTTKELDRLFTPLAKNISQLIGVVKTKSTTLPTKKYPITEQQKLNNLIAGQLGYDFDLGRIDESPHPFTVTFHATDVRTTTRYDEYDFWIALGSVIHEVGHALYEQGLPPKYFGTPLGEPVSIGVHETQSRLWENFVGRSQPFASYLYPLLTKYFGKLGYTQDRLYHWLNRIGPSPIRVESDEVTYNLHIVLRYELEKSLIEGKLKVSDLPAAWNEKMEKYLGLKITKDSDGVLQDVHWAHGTFGYFPTYTLGNLGAAQFYATAKKQIPNLENNFSRGDFKPFLDWLRKNIHSQGRRYSSSDLIEKVTGEKLSPDYLIRHLEDKVNLTA